MHRHWRLSAQALANGTGTGTGVKAHWQLALADRYVDMHRHWRLCARALAEKMARDTLQPPAPLTWLE